jgi:hypothetical protein
LLVYHDDGGCEPDRDGSNGIDGVQNSRPNHKGGLTHPIGFGTLAKLASGGLGPDEMKDLNEIASPVRE